MARHGKLRTLLEYSDAKSVLIALGQWPPPAAYAVGRAIGKLAYTIARDLRRTGAINLRIAFPEKSDEERAQLLRECFYSIGRELGLFSQMSSRSRETLGNLVEMQNLEILEEARKTHGDKLIYYTGHLGAWEVT